MKTGEDNQLLKQLVGLWSRVPESDQVEVVEYVTWLAKHRYLRGGPFDGLALQDSWRGVYWLKIEHDPQRVAVYQRKHDGDYFLYFDGFANRNDQPDITLGDVALL